MRCHAALIPAPTALQSLLPELDRIDFDDLDEPNYRPQYLRARAAALRQTVQDMEKTGAEATEPALGYSRRGGGVAGSVAPVALIS